MTDPMHGRWADLDQGPAASAQMIQWHAPKTWAAIRDTVISEMAARGWEHADRGSLALVLDKVREAGFTDGLHASRDVDRLGYVVVRHGPALWQTDLVDDRIHSDRDTAQEIADEHPHGPAPARHAVAELLVPEET